MTRAWQSAHRVLKADGCALMYDVVRDMPKAVCEDVHARFGGFRLALLWLHSFEEPFLNAEEMDALGRRTDFVVEGTRFTGALCCLSDEHRCRRPIRAWFGRANARRTCPPLA